MMGVLQYIKKLNRYRKTDKFKNKAYKVALGFFLLTSAVQIAFFLKPIPNFGKRGGEIDQG